MFFFSYKVDIELKISVQKSNVGTFFHPFFWDNFLPSLHFLSQFAMSKMWHKVIFLPRFLSLRLVALLRQKKTVYYLHLAVGRRDGFMPFLSAIAQIEMLSALSRIWAWVANSISSDNNHCTMCASYFPRNAIEGFTLTVRLKLEWFGWMVRNFISREVNVILYIRYIKPL